MEELKQDERASFEAWYETDACLGVEPTWAAWQARAAHSAAAIPEGWKLVPVEPTPEMLEAGLKRKAEAIWKDGATPFRARTENLRPVQEVAALQWAAMLSASPSAPGAEQAKPVQAMTEQEIRKASAEAFMSDCYVVDFARAIERHLAAAWGVKLEGGEA